MSGVIERFTCPGKDKQRGKYSRNKRRKLNQYYITFSIEISIRKLALRFNLSSKLEYFPKTKN